MITVTYKLTGRNGNTLTESECFDSRPQSDEIKASRNTLKERFRRIYSGAAISCDITVSPPDSETYDDGVFA